MTVVTPGLAALALVCLAVVAWPPGARSERPFGGSRPDGDEVTPMSIAYAMDLLALALAGGAPSVIALEAVGEAGPPGVRDDLGRVAAALRWGVGDDGAWSAASTAWRPAASAFALSARAGAAPANLLTQAAADLRAAEAERVAVAGAKAGVRIVLPLGLCFLPAFILLTIVPLVLGLVGPMF